MTTKPAFHKVSSHAAPPMKVQTLGGLTTASEMGRAKRATNPFDDELRRTSGESAGDFFFPDYEDSNDARRADDDGGGGFEGSDDEERPFIYSVPVALMIRDLVTPWSAPPVEEWFRRNLTADATTAANRFAGMRQDRAAFQRAVMTFLREMGYDAGLCNTTACESGCTGYTGYAYIDVLASTAAPPATQKRFIVDVKFAEQFAIARPTEEYEKLLRELPPVFVGAAEDLRRLLGILADAARRSLRSREMHLPPWRKSRYILAKWLGPYRRSIGPSSPSSRPAAAAPPQLRRPKAAAPFVRGDVKCRLVGFDAAVSAVLPAAARTR